MRTASDFLLSILQCNTAASPPSVRKGYAFRVMLPSPCGFAARCVERLCLSELCYRDLAALPPDVRKGHAFRVMLPSPCGFAARCAERLRLSGSLAKYSEAPPPHGLAHLKNLDLKLHKLLYLPQSPIQGKLTNVFFPKMPQMRLDHILRRRLVRKLPYAARPRFARASSCGR